MEEISCLCAKGHRTSSAVLGEWMITFFAFVASVLCDKDNEFGFSTLAHVQSTPVCVLMHRTAKALHSDSS